MKHLRCVFLLGACWMPATLVAQVVDSAGPRQAAVEAGLLPRVVVAGDSSPGHSMSERMEHFRVPGVSVAVMRDGTVDWAQGYGVLEAGSADRVTTSTLFQAASLSKPVTASLVLRLAERGLLDLDADVNDALESWRVPPGRQSAAHPVTLRKILSHTAGLTVSGFPGYGVDDEIPTAVDVLAGRGNTDPVRVDTIPGTISRYSGGGYTVAQLLVEDVERAPFAELVAREVLRPLGMYRSTYGQPLAARWSIDAARGHNGDGSPVEGGWHVYPELAPAGLWTTPTDLARFVLGVRAAWLGSPGAFLGQATARAMLTPDEWGSGLGFQVAGDPGAPVFLHTGSNRGYKAIVVMHANSGDGVAVLTSGDRGGDLMMEVVRAVSDAYGWPDFKARSQTIVSLDQTGVDRFLGAYSFLEEPDYIAHVVREEAALYIVWPDSPRMRLLPISETEFFVEDDGTPLVFEPEGLAGVLEWDGADRARLAE